MTPKSPTESFDFGVQHSKSKNYLIVSVFLLKNKEKYMGLFEFGVQNLLPKRSL